MKKIVYLLVIALAFVACKNDDHKTKDPDVYNLKMVNTSGQLVEVFCYNADNKVFPEHLTLEDGKEYIWKIDKNAANPLPSSVKLVWSGYSLEYGSDQIKDDIDPRFFENYEYVEGGDIAYRYTFTKERYQSVLDRYKMIDVNNKCVMVNNSGVNVVVKIDVKDPSIVFSDNITLAPNAKYEWSFISKERETTANVKTSFVKPTPVPFGEPSPSSATIIFENNFTVEYSVESGRDPRNAMNYTKEKVSDNNYLYTYTFTKEDYQNAKNSHI